jgi:integrase
MACLTKIIGKRGTTWRIEYFDARNKRRCIRLGKIDKRQAESIKARVELLVAAKIMGTAPDVETSRWVAERDDVLHGKLVQQGLVEPREKFKVRNLGPFLDDYIGKRTDVKPGTATVYRHTRRCLVEFFGADKPLASITFADVKDWRRWLARPISEGGQGLADNTVRRRCGLARQFLAEAVDARLIAENPFAKMKGVAVKGNRGRYFFVERDVAQAVLDVCPDDQWKLLFALSRFGGLRCPSEHLSLQWDDINWENGRITIRSPKTEHHEGKESREIPLFPELRPYLEALYDEAKPGIDCPLSSPVITRYRNKDTNLRTQLCKIIRRAGLKPWPKLFQNLRSTRETELAEDFPIHVVCDWIGNSEAVAARHYLQTTDEHFSRAVQNAQQKAQQSASALGRTDRNTEEQPYEYAEDFADPREREACGVGDTGLEPVTSAV